MKKYFFPDLDKYGFISFSYNKKQKTINDTYSFK